MRDLHAPPAIGLAWDDIAVGDSARLTRLCTAADLIVFAHASGNLNPRHIPGEAEQELGAAADAPAMWGGAMFSALLGNRLPGPGTEYLAQSLMFRARVRPGDEVTAIVTVREKRAGRQVVLDCRLEKAGGECVVEGEAVVRAPAQRVATDGVALPALAIAGEGHFRHLIEACRLVPPLPTAVVLPTEPQALAGACDAAAAGLISPILLGPAAAITAAAEGRSLTGLRIEECAPEEAAARAVALVREGTAQAIMKGNLHTDELLAEVLRPGNGLRTPRRMSHAFVLDVPGRSGLLLISDAAINILPDLVAKVDIVQNAIDLARAIGLLMPRVGLLSAVETVTPKIPSTLDAAAISKMAERGQIRGALVDGPLAMDNAIDLGAAATKGLHSEVAGRADVLIAPNLEAGNMLAKQLVFLSGADSAGLALGAAVPVMLTSRADDARARLVSAALAVLYAHWRRTGASLVGAEP
jgi:phosphate butyryltransferase